MLIEFKIAAALLILCYILFKIADISMSPDQRYLVAKNKSNYPDYPMWTGLFILLMLLGMFVGVIFLLVGIFKL